MKKSHTVLIFCLALGIFGIITTEMGMIGVLPQLAQKFGISPAQAGLLISVFALTVAVAGPFVTLFVSGLNRKTMLLVSVLIFAVSNAVYAYTTSFEVMLLFRILPAIFHPVFFSIALATAAGLVSPEKSGQVVTRVMAGVTVGFAFGIPLTAYLGAYFSLEAAFGFGALVSTVSFFGLAVGLPNVPSTRRKSPGSQLGILRLPQLRLTLLIVVLIFAAMSSVYSYFAEYLRDITHMNETWISAMLMVFGITMIAGNFLFGFFVNKSPMRTATVFLLVYAAVYAAAYYGGDLIGLMAVIIFVWGAVHAGGLIIGQGLLIRDASAAPEFGNSLFLSFSNIGIAAGTWSGGLFISVWGTHQLILSGVLALSLAFVLLILRISIFSSSSRQPN